MNILARTPKDELLDAAELNIRRVVELWRDCRRRFGCTGPFLFSDFTAADAMYAPVASRFKTYLPDLEAFGDDGTARAYIETIFALPEMQVWMAEAAEELASAPT